VLRDGRPAVVKVRRPDIVQTMHEELDVIHDLAELAETHWPEVRAYQPVEIAEELAKSLRRELDLSREAAATAKFRTIYEDDTRVETPGVIWSHTRDDVLTMTRVSGVPLTNIEAVDSVGVDRKSLAKTTATVFLEQFFEHGVFHADPHPGNLMAVEGDRIGLLDYGAVGTVRDDIKPDMAALLFSVTAHNMDLTASVYEELGVVPPGNDRADMVSDFEDLFRGYVGMPSNRMDMRRLFGEILDITRRHHTRVPRELVVFLRALVTAFNSVKTLDPEISVADVIGPYTRDLLSRRLRPSSMAQSWTRPAYQMHALARHMPGNVREILKKLSSGQLRVPMQHEGLEGLQRELDRTASRVAFSMIISAIIIGSSYIMSADVGPTWDWLSFMGLGDVPLLGFIGFMVAGVMGLDLAWNIYRSGSLGR
jgi:ubiquinone biosynthesis protein